VAFRQVGRGNNSYAVPLFTKLCITIKMIAFILV